MKIHISLVGGQETPVYQGIIYSESDHIILVCSDLSLNRAKVIQQELKNYNGSLMIISINDNNTKIMKNDIDKIRQSINDEDLLSLNLSSGTKPWSILFYQLFENRPNTDIFCIGQNGELFDLKNYTTGKVPFDMDTQFRLRGQKLTSYTPLSQYDNSDWIAYNKIFGIFKSKYHSRFQLITKDFHTKYVKVNAPSDILNKPLSCDHRNYDKGFTDHLSWNPDKNEFILDFGDEEEIRLSSTNIMSLILNTGWFEYFVAKRLGDVFGVNNIRLNCVFSNSLNQTKNEVDIIVNATNKLIFVECKTQVANSTDVDKFNSVVKNYGGLGSKHLFVTNYEMKKDALEKCNDYGIETYHTYQPEKKISKEQFNQEFKKFLKNLVKNSNA